MTNEFIWAEMEELGAAYCRDWLEEITQHKIPVIYIPGTDTFQFMLPEIQRNANPY